MARRRTKRKMTVELVNRNELLNLRLLSETLAHSYKQRGAANREQEI